MDCETLRRQLNEDPGAAREAFTRHAETCAACSAYGRRADAAEKLIREALAFDVEGVRAATTARSSEGGDIGGGPARSLAGHGRKWVPAFAAAAGTLIGALAVWFVLAPAPRTGAEQLAVEVVEHWFEEPGSWSSSGSVVAAGALDSVLDGKARIDLGAIGPVSYARSCFVAGQWVPHLVVQGESGPFMVLLMPEQTLETPVRLTLDEEGLAGHALPVGSGSIAVLGADADEAVIVEQAVADAVEWTI